MFELSFADFFCGAGGLSLGLSNAGLVPALAFDGDRYSCATYERNLSIAAICAMHDNVDSSDLPDTWRGKLSLICGGPPCQGFSLQRRGPARDDRNDLVLWFFKIAVRLDPKVILMENVPTVFGSRGRLQLAKVYDLLDSAGYFHDQRVLDAADFGVPQSRRRGFLVAWRPDLIWVWPKPTHDDHTRRTVRNAIGDLPPPGKNTQTAAVANHVRVNISALSEARISHVPPGGGRLDIPPDLQLSCHRTDNGHRHLDVFGRMEWDRPAPTITAMFDSFTRGRFAHPEENRPITGREGARLQSFPDTFHFVGPKKDVARQIGNAVPPLLAYHLGDAVKAALIGETQPASEQLRLRHD